LVEIFEILNKQNRGEEIFEYEIENFNHQIYYEMAYSKLRKRDFIKAEEFINKALEQEVNNKNLLLKGQILFKQNKEDDCYEILESFDEKKLDATQNNFIGLILQYKGEYKKAISYFLKAIKENSQVDEYYYNCASTYFKMGDKVMAKNYYNLAISLNPENQNYHFALANLYYSEKQYRRAMEELDYDFFEANLLKSIILYETGYVALAKKNLEKIIEERPDNLVIQEYMKKVNDALKF
jgi:tetratricopeptide (TPR) repeat protein